MADLLDKRGKGLPCNVDAEKFVLGSILLDDEHYSRHEAQLKPEDFTLAKHRTIFSCMRDLHAAEDRIDRVTVANRLMAKGELESVDGLSYLVSLDDGLPTSPNLDSYIGILRDKSALRQIVYLSEKARAVAIEQIVSPIKITRDLSKVLKAMELSMDSKGTAQTAADIVAEHGGLAPFLTEAIKPGISTGFPKLDDAIMGLQAGCHYIIGGRTSSGKTALAGNIALHVAKNGHPVVVFSLEMRKEILLARAVCAEAEVPFTAYIRKQLDHTQREKARHALQEIMDLPFYVEDAAGMTVGEFSSRVDQAVLRYKARVVMLDYLQLLSPDADAKYPTPYQTVTLASKACRLAARANAISTIALSQLSRPADKRKPNTKPQLGDLKESGGIENDAEAALLIHREEMYDHQNQNAKGLAEVIVAKSRAGGLCSVNLRFRGAWYKFTEPPTEPTHAYGGHHTDHDDDEDDDD